MRAPYREFLNDLRERLLGPNAKLAREVREAIVDGRPVDGPLGAFVRRVRANASSVTQAHIDELKASGVDEDAIFEATVCTAFAAGQERHRVVMKYLEEASRAS